MFENLKHYDGEPAHSCPVCGHDWDEQHQPVREDRGWNRELNVPAWAWVCKQCTLEEQ